MIIPNSYQKPNWLTDQMMWLLTGDEWKVLDYALRRTFGFNRERDRISVSQFMNGNGKLDEQGRSLEHGTGLSRGAVLDALGALMRVGILIEVAPNNRDNHGRLWELQLDGNSVRVDLLLERREGKAARGRLKTAAARRASRAARQGDDAGDATQAADAVEATTAVEVAVELSPGPNAFEGAGLSHRPAMESGGAVCGTDRGRSVGQTGGGLWDRHTETQKKPRRNPGRNTL